MKPSEGDGSMARISPEKYRDILSGLELENISLREVRARLDREALEGPLVVRSDAKAEYSRDGEQVTVLNTYTVSANARNRKDPAVHIEATYELLFTSKRSFTVGFFNVYKKLNLHLHLWPFMRELVNSITARMGVSAMTLPLLKT